MKISDQQMLAIWRRVHRLEPARSDCSIETFEGYDLDAAMQLDMRQWYLQLLDTAETRYLELSDVASQLSLTALADGVWQIALPADVRRLIAMQIDGCAQQTIVTNVADAQRQITLNTNRYSRAGLCAPVAVAQGRTVTLFCKTATGEAPQLLRVQAVTDPGDEWYVFDESALSLIPNTPDYLNE
jgi:hypothetical protein